MASYRQYRSASNYRERNPDPMPMDFLDPMTWSPETRYHLKSVPIFGDWIEAVEGLDFAKRYMDTYGLTWDDIRYVTKLPGPGYGRAAMSTLNYVSRNIGRLYR